MPDLTLQALHPSAAKRIKPFLDEILEKYRDRIHSIYITGTAITDDYNDKSSDINSIFVLKEMDIKFLEILAPLGKKYGKNRVAAPLIMTPGYIDSSRDVFPVEFLNFKLIHSTVFGEDILKDIEIKKKDLRYQCERELKTKLIWLGQGYLSSLGHRKLLTEKFVNSITGYIPLFRALIVLFGKEAPVRQSDVITALSEAMNINTGVFAKVLKEKRERIKLSVEELNTIFEDYYAATEKLGKMVDEIKE
jgi:predicted nucleotidyltransferase